MCLYVLCTERTFNNYDSFVLPTLRFDVATRRLSNSQRHICHHKETPSNSNSILFDSDKF